MWKALYKYCTLWLTLLVEGMQGSSTYTNSTMIPFLGKYDQVHT